MTIACDFNNRPHFLNYLVLKVRFLIFKVQTILVDELLCTCIIIRLDIYKIKVLVKFYTRFFFKSFPKEKKRTVRE